MSDLSSIDILADHQEWRRGVGKYEGDALSLAMVSPRRLGEAIDDVLKLAKIGRLHVVIDQIQRDLQVVADPQLLLQLEGQLAVFLDQLGNLIDAYNANENQLP